MMQITDIAHSVSGVLKIPRFVCDAGNRQIKFGSKDIQVVPSYLKLLNPWDEPVPDPHSCFVNYTGGNTKLVGRWVVGALAQELGGTATFKTEKAELLPRLALAAIKQTLGRGRAIIQNLRLCLPDDLNSEKVEVIRKVLVGTHQLDDLVVQIQSITVEPEGAGAYRWLRHTAQYRYDRINGTLDFGGGNTTAQLFSKSGMLLRDTRLTLPGTYKLAEAIAADPSLLGTEGKGNSPKTELIMDAIADSSYTYGNTNVSFAQIFPRCRDMWLTGIREEIRTRWASYLSQIGEVLMIGGSAVLAEPLVEQTKGRFKIAQDPVFCTAKGMLLS
jgi:hypothetical protein